MAIPTTRKMRTNGPRIAGGTPSVCEFSRVAWQPVLGPRFLWGPTVERPRRPWFGVVSSRIGRLGTKTPETRAAWVAHLRRVCRTIREMRGTLLIVSGSPIGPYVRRAARLFHLPTLTIALPDESEHPSCSGFDSPSNDGEQHAFLSSDADSTERQERSHPGSRPSTNVGRTHWRLLPRAEPNSAARRCRGEDASRIPLADRVLAMVADRVEALSVRSGGNIERTLELRLALGGTPAGVHLALDPCLLRTKTKHRLLELGAVGHVPPPATVGLHTPTQEVTRTCPSTEQFHDHREFLVHCTRAATGPWPSQRLEDYLDDLLLPGTAGDRTPLATLTHILKESRLRASHKNIRGKHPVVCFSAVPLPQLIARRRFQSHLARWDFEPYGIAIRRSALTRLGARPVLYGDTAKWKTLPPSDRPFFQAQHTRLRSNKTGTGTRVQDWTQEREWRVASDVFLDSLAPTDARVFVPHQDAARAVRRWCRFPILLASVPTDHDGRQLTANI